ncbi:MAG: hypothetical protein V4654_10120 [Bdellovibrionota bacterium]
MKTLIFSLLLSQLTFANTTDVITPTDIEKKEYLAYNRQIVQMSSECIQNYWATHVAFFNKNKVSKYYGSNNPKLKTREQRIAALKKAGAPTSLVDQLESTSCIGMARACMKQAFFATKSDVIKDLWNRMDKILVANGADGSILANNLQTLGWKILYWNPKPEDNSLWDKQDVKNLTSVKVVKWDSGVKNSKGEFVYHSGWGMHASRYREVMKKDKYYVSKIDDKTTLVNFGSILPESFKRAPFFLGVAHAGYHVFPGFYGQVIEAHSSRQLDSISNMERGVFNPLNGGSPMWSNTEWYRSGIVAVPPET